jgi:hypothetical protein
MGLLLLTFLAQRSFCRAFESTLPSTLLAELALLTFTLEQLEQCDKRIPLPVQ